jgi:hypothetical protein
LVKCRLVSSGYSFVNHKRKIIRQDNALFLSPVTVRGVRLWRKGHPIVFKAAKPVSMETFSGVLEQIRIRLGASHHAFRDVIGYPGYTNTVFGYQAGFSQPRARSIRAALVRKHPKIFNLFKKHFDVTLLDLPLGCSGSVARLSKQSDSLIGVIDEIRLAAGMSRTGFARACNRKKRSVTPVMMSRVADGQINFSQQAALYMAEGMLAHPVLAPLFMERSDRYAAEAHRLSTFSGKFRITLPHDVPAFHILHLVKAAWHKSMAQVLKKAARHYGTPAQASGRRYFSAIVQRNWPRLTQPQPYRPEAPPPHVLPVTIGRTAALEYMREYPLRAEHPKLYHRFEQLVQSMPA